MLVWATRRLPDYVARGAILAALFVLVVVLQIGLTSGLRAAGAGSGVALALAGFAVLGLVLGTNWAIKRNRMRRLAAIEAARLRQGLPDGPCCVVWSSESAGEAAWAPEATLKVRYPRLARRLGVEGAVVIEVEIDDGGRAGNLRCVDVWPSRVFYRAAAAALDGARFTMQGGRGRLDRTVRVPFVFRISGAVRRRRTHR
ncbi:MAG: TonB family protein [Alphaproteobacteria bacterium]|nr:TonB family protein [Alphaproteobacteria bacterium]